MANGKEGNGEHELHVAAAAATKTENVRTEKREHTQQKRQRVSEKKEFYHQKIRKYLLGARISGRDTYGWAIIKKYLYYGGLRRECERWPAVWLGLTAMHGTD